MHLLDASILLCYIVGVFVLAWWSGKNKEGSPQDSAKEQFLAGQSLTWIESICSIIATEVSALTFLGIPALAFDTNFSFVQIYIGAIFGRLIIAYFFLPKVYNSGLTVYEVMAKGCGLPSGQRTVAIMYSISKILSVGVRLFSGCILVSAFLGLSITTGILLVTVLTFLYTLIGGLKAVARTDVVQMALFVGGGIAAHLLIPDVSQQSWGDMMSIAVNADKTLIVDFSNPVPFVYGLLGGFLFDMATHGVDQDFVQRLTAGRSLKQGQWVIFLSSFLSIAMGLLFLSVGALLFVYHQSHPLPADFNSDLVFSTFIVQHFPVGVQGLMVAGVLAATMSTLDSTINALCATLYNDILPKSSTQNFRNIRNSSIISGALLIVALIASNSDGMLMLGLKIQSWTGGTLLGIFVATVLLSKYIPVRLTTGSVLFAYLFGTLGVASNIWLLEWDWNFNVYLGFGCSLLALWLWSKWIQTSETA